MGLQVDPIAAQDPEYLAFMRGAGYSEAEVLAELARKQGSLQRQLERSAPRFADELRTTGEAVKNDFEGRGLYRSGGRMVQQVDAENAVRRNEQEFRFGIADQQGDLNSAAMRDIAEGRRQAADMMLTSRQTAAINAANANTGGMPTGHTLGPEPGNGGAPGGRPLPASNPNSSNAGRTRYDNFRRNTLRGRVGPTNGRSPSAY
jgi:hypothetical protein